MTFKSILIATDGSERSKNAIDKALELSKVTGANVFALHVMDPSIFNSMPAATPMPDVHRSMEREGNDILEYVHRRGEEMGVKVTTILREGIPDRVIVEESEAHDLIVVGTLGRTGLSKLIMGSVAERVVRSCKPPVLVVK